MLFQKKISFSSKEQFRWKPAFNEKKKVDQAFSYTRNTNW